MSRTPRAWPRQDGGGAASAPTSRSPSGPPSRVAATPQRARARKPSRPPLWGRSTGHRRTEVSQAARATAPEAQGAARSVRSHCADASHPGPRGHGRCIERGVAQSSAAQSSSPRRHPRSCDPALTTRSPGSAASQSDPGPTGASLPDPRRSDAQQPAPWPASAPHGAPAYPLLNNPGSLNPSSSPGARITVSVEAAQAVKGALRVSYRVAGASWTPLYDARLETGAKDRKPGLELVRRAQVVQRTGEDWTDVELAVSTVRVNRGATAPDLPPVLVSFVEPSLPASAAARLAEDRQALQGFQDRADERLKKAAPAAPASEVQASVEAGAFQATFRVPGRAS